MYQVVKTNFTKNSISQPSKTIATVLLDGSYTKEDLRSINVAFPSNSLNALKDPEGPYNGQEAMFQFIRTIGPYLSDQNLFRLVDALTELACDAGESVLRASSLARCALLYEFERSAKTSLEDNFPDQFLSHFKRHLVPLFARLNANTVADNIARLGTHNLNETVIDPTLAAQYRSRNLFQAVSQFDETKFNADNLSSQPPADKKEFEALLGKDKKASPPRSDPYQISRPKGEAIEATAFFTTTAKVGNAMASEIQLLNKECATLAKRIDTNSEILKKLAAELPKETDEATIKHYSNVKIRLEDEIRADADQLQSKKTAIARLEDKLPGIGPKR